MVREVDLGRSNPPRKSEPQILPTPTVASTPDLLLPTPQDLADLEPELAAILREPDKIVLEVNQRTLDLLLKDSLGLTLVQLRPYTIPTPQEYENYKLLYWLDLFHRNLRDRATEHKVPALVDFHENRLTTLAPQIKAFQENRMVLGNWRFAFAVAKKYCRRKDDLLDFFQCGNIGLIQAAKTYDPFKDCQFSTWACWYIKANIFLFIAQETGVDPRQRNRIQELRQSMERAGSKDLHFLAVAKLRQRVRNFDELEDRVQAYKIQAQIMRFQALLDLEGITNCTSLDMSVKGEDGAKIGSLLRDLIPDADPDIPDIVAEADLAEKIRRVLKLLSPRQQTVLSLRFGLGKGEEMTKEEIGNVLNITRQRVDTILKIALRKLRHPARIKPFKGYFD